MHFVALRSAGYNNVDLEAADKLGILIARVPAYSQLVLVVDRDSEIFAHDFDERNDAVKIMISQLIRVARENGKKSESVGKRPAIILSLPDFWLKIKSTVFL